MLHILKVGGKVQKEIWSMSVFWVTKPPCTEQTEAAAPFPDPQDVVIPYAPGPTCEAAPLRPLGETSAHTLVALLKELYVYQLQMLLPIPVAS